MSSAEDGTARQTWLYIPLAARAAHLSPLTARSLRNFLFSGSRYVARPAVSLISTPILLSYLGVSQYGIWMIVTSILGVSAIADFGVLDSIVRYVSKHHAVGDEAAIVRTIRSAVSLCAIVGLAVMAFLAVTASYVTGHVFRMAPEEQTLAISAIRLAGPYFLFAFVNAGFRNALRGCHRYDLDAKLDVGFEVLTTLTNVVLAFSGRGLAAILVSMTVWSLIEICVTALTLKRMVVRSMVFWPLLSRSVLGESAGYAAFMWSQGVTAMLLANFDRLLIGSLLGPDSLAYYAVALQLAKQVHGFLSNALAFLFPTFSEISEAGSKARLSRLYRRAFSATLVAALLIAVPLYVLGPLILKLWLGENIASMAQVSLRILVCYFFVTTLTIIPHYFLNGIGNSRLNAIYLGAASIASIGAALLLLPRFGAPGAALARLAIVPVCGILWGVIHHRMGLGVLWTIVPTGLAALAIVTAVGSL